MQNTSYKIRLLVVIVLSLAITPYIVYKVSPDNRIYYNLHTALNNPLKVSKLNLQEQKLTDLPADIPKLQNLTELDLAKNQLTELNILLTQLPKLKLLNLEYNALNSLPKDIESLYNLQELNLAWNNLEELPKTITKLPQLQQLDLTGNALTMLPPSIKNLHKSLKVLNLSYNPINQTQLETVQKWLPNTKIICEDSFFVASNYREFYNNLNKNNSFINFYNNFKPQNLDLTNFYFKKTVYQQVVRTQTIKLYANTLNDYPSYILKRFHHLQEVHLNSFVTIKQLEQVLATFPNLKGISLELNSNTDTLLEHLTTTSLKWIKLSTQVHQNGVLTHEIPDIFYSIPQAKILEITNFTTSYKEKEELPKIKKTIDALILNKIYSMPQNFEQLPPIKSLFIQKTRNWQGIPKLKGLEFLNMSNTKDLFADELAFLKDLSQLKKLYLDNCKLYNINHCLLPHLKNLKQLKVLSIKNHLDKDLDKKALQAALPNVKIIGL